MAIQKLWLLGVFIPQGHIEVDPNTGTVCDHLNGAATIPEIVAANPNPDDGNDGDNAMDNNPTPRPNVVQTVNANGNSHANPTPHAHHNHPQLLLFGFFPANPNQGGNGGSDTASTNVSTIVEVVSTNTRVHVNGFEEIVHLQMGSSR